LDHIPVFGKEGALLPLGPEVQHTGELKPGLDLNEIWTFASPRYGFKLPAVDLDITGDGLVANLPQGVKVISL
jgi:alpha-glucosidase (family GH31 glycosyl hydrolase)